MDICELFIQFIIYSVMGWIYETIFCTVKNKRWENRGFLYGPVVPIYGAGAVILAVLLRIIDKELSWWQIFLLGYVGSVILEYVTHWGLERLFHAKWWDYSSVPLNIKGRVCVPASIGFGLASVLIAYVIIPFVSSLTAWLPAFAIDLAALVLTAALAWDTALTVSALTGFDRELEAIDNALNRRMEELVQSVVERKEESEEERRLVIERITERMGGTGLSALKRVKSFTPKKALENASKNLSERKNRALEFIKKHRR